VAAMPFASVEQLDALRQPRISQKAQLFILHDLPPPSAHFNHRQFIALGATSLSQSTISPH
jgi:hypothetical protein